MLKEGSQIAALLFIFNQKGEIIFMDPTRPNPNAITDERIKSDAFGKNREIRQIQRVTTGKVQRKKASTTSKFANVFLAEDTGDIKSYVIFDILVPAIKDTIAEAVTRTVDMLFYGKDRRPSKSGGYVSYNSYSSKNSRREYVRPRQNKEMDSIIFESRDEAEQVLDTMLEIIDKYGDITIEDYYDLAGVTSNNYTNRYFGWIDLRGAYVTRERGGGYSIKLPRPQDLK